MDDCFDIYVHDILMFQNMEEPLYGESVKKITIKKLLVYRSLKKLLL